MSNNKPTADNSAKKFLEAFKAGRVKSVQFDAAALGAALGAAFAESLDLGFDPPTEDSAIYCNEQYHFARFQGSGSSLVPLLYAISLHVAGIDGTFFLSMTKLRRFLNVTNDHLVYDAASLLRRSGFWRLIETIDGKPTKYRPLTHKQWHEKYGEPLKLCPQKCADVPFRIDDKLGTKLYAILGGETYHPNVLKGLRNTGASDERIMELATQFIAADGGNEAGKERRKRLQQFVTHAMAGKVVKP